jgi:hypothetical protein
MKGVAWMAGGSVASWLAAVAVAGTQVRSELLFGMLGPLVVAVITWVMAEWTYRRNPRALTGLMIAAFGCKLVFFGAYVAVMLRVVHLSPTPFAVSFSSYFIALHVVEALFLQRLFAGGPRA